MFFQERQIEIYYIDSLLFVIPYPMACWLYWMLISCR